jgi:hypothetical protein
MSLSLYNGPLFLNQFQAMYGLHLQHTAAMKSFEVNALLGAIAFQGQKDQTDPQNVLQELQQMLGPNGGLGPGVIT